MSFQRLYESQTHGFAGLFTGMFVFLVQATVVCSYGQHEPHAVGSLICYLLPWGIYMYLNGQQHPSAPFSKSRLQVFF